MMPSGIVSTRPWASIKGIKFLDSLKMVPNSKPKRNVTVTWKTIPIKLVGDNVTDPKCIFKYWELNYKYDKDNCNDFKILFDYKPLECLSVLNYREINKKGDLYTNTWEDICEAIQDDKDPLPEHEFITNCFEHLDSNNLRMAIIECIMALEIVLSQYLDKYLKLIKKLPRKRIDNFISPDLGIKARISVLLNLTMPDDDIGKVKINDILILIGWRNKIIHKSGHIKGVKEKEIHKKISSAFYLIQLLARKRDLIILTPEIQAISNQIKEKYDTVVPNINLFERHRVTVTFTVIFEKGLPNKNKFIDMQKFITSKFIKRDSHFIPEKHLIIKYNLLNKTKLVWENDNIYER